MILSAVRWLIVVGAILALPVGTYAQEATVNGTVTDQTGGVLRGVTVTAVHESSGNTFLAVTDERGAFRLPVRIGLYRVTAELPGFATVTHRQDSRSWSGVLLETTTCRLRRSIVCYVYTAGIR